MPVIESYYFFLSKAQGSGMAAGETQKQFPSRGDGDNLENHVEGASFYTRIRTLLLGKPTNRSLWILFAVACVIVTIGCIDLINIQIDDIYVTLRYSRNTAEGYGPVFNIGQHAVEGYSSPAWMFSVAGLAALTGLTGHFQLYFLARAFSAVFGILTIALLIKMAKDRGNCFAAVAFLVLAVAAAPFLNIYTFSGMENPLVTFLVTLTFFFYLLWHERGGRNYAIAFAVALGLLAISRPEGVMYPVAAYAGLFLMGFRKFGGIKLPHLYLTLGVVVAIVGAFLAFRLSFYGAPFPNTLYAKNDPRLSRLLLGSTYLFTFLSLAVIPFTPALLLKKSALAKAIYWPMYTVILAQFAFVVYAGGDWFPGFRLLLPVLPLVLFLLFDQMDLSAFGRDKLFAACAVAVLVIGASVVLQRENTRLFQNFVTGFQFKSIVPIDKEFYATGEKLAELSKPKQSVLTAQVGVIPYLNDDVYFNDLWGLVDSHISRDIKGPHGSRVDNTYFFDGNYDYVVYVISGGKPDYVPKGKKLPSEINGIPQSGFYAVDTFINDPRFSKQYELIYRGDRGVIFKRIGVN